MAGLEALGFKNIDPGISIAGPEGTYWHPFPEWYKGARDNFIANSETPPSEKEITKQLASDLIGYNIWDAPFDIIRRNNPNLKNVSPDQVINYYQRQGGWIEHPNPSAGGGFWNQIADFGLQLISFASVATGPLTGSIAAANISGASKDAGIDPKITQAISLASSDTSKLFQFSAEKTMDLSSLTGTAQDFGNELPIGGTDAFAFNESFLTPHDFAASVEDPLRAAVDSAQASSDISIPIDAGNDPFGVPGNPGPGSSVLQAVERIGSKFAGSIIGNLLGNPHPAANSTRPQSSQTLISNTPPSKATATPLNMGGLAGGVGVTAGDLKIWLAVSVGLILTFLLVGAFTRK